MPNNGSYNPSPKSEAKNKMRDNIQTCLKPIYTELLSQLGSEKDIYPFCVQWGMNFFEKDNERILFVGKATNGWVTNSTDVEVLFGSSNKRIFNRNDQMIWIDNLKGNQKGYDTKKSAFWRVILKTSENVLQKKDVTSRIAWSNLYKISYQKGNPDEKLKEVQKECCKRILEQEIKALSPKYVVFLTSFWEKVFLKHLNNGVEPIPKKTIKWGSKYYSKSYKINDVTYIASQHPQGKKEVEHIKVLTALLQKETTATFQSCVTVSNRKSTSPGATG